MAFSAIRAGFRPICFDYFADADLQRAMAECGSTVTKIAGYDDATLRLLEKLPSDVPLMYGGAVENHPQFVDRIAANRPLWGVCGEVLRRCRDPWEVQCVAKRCGLYALACHRQKPDRGAHVWKPFASGGGLDINNPVCGKPGYWQQQADGWGCYSAFVVRSPTSGVTFLGNSEEDGLGETVSRRGREHGLIRPGLCVEEGGLIFDAAVIAMADEFGLVGAFGIDFIDDDISIERTCVLEVNPRWTATAELHERVSGTSLVSLHAAAFDDRFAPVRFEDRVERSRKVVFFAPSRVRTFIPGPVLATDRYPLLADVPPVGTIVEKGEPICSVFFDDTPRDPQVREAQLNAAEESILSQCERMRV